MGGIQGAIESVCCVGCMRGVFQGVHKWRVCSMSGVYWLETDF